MNFLLALGGCVGEAAVIYTVLILARLSEKLGSVTKMRPYYRGFYVSIALFGLSLAARLTWIGMAAAGSEAQLQTETFSLLAHHVPLALGAFIALAIATKYWGWLLRE